MAAPKGNKHALGNKGGPGQKPLYDKERHCRLAFNFALLGGTDVELANAIGVTEKTINSWKREHKEFGLALKRGKDEADGHVAESLYHRALGSVLPDSHVTNYQGAVTITKMLKHYPPDPAAAIFWLKNRKQLKWRDRLEHTGEGGGPLTVKVVSFTGGGNGA